MITDKMIDAAASALENISFTGKVSPVNGYLEINLDSKLCAKASLETAYPLIRQQVLKEVNDAISKLAASRDLMYWEGIAHCQRIVCDMMEGGE